MYSTLLISNDKSLLYSYGKYWLLGVCHEAFDMILCSSFVLMPFCYCLLFFVLRIRIIALLADGSPDRLERKTELQANPFFI